MPGNEPDKTAEQKQLFAGIFDRSAPTYDHIGPRFFSHYGQSLVELAQIKKGDHVLDVACGRGAALFPAVHAVGAQGRVVGIDIAETMIRETGFEIRQLGFNNVTVEQMDAESLDFPERSFDCVLCGFALFFFPRLDRSLAEMRRVLKPGGCLAVSTWEKYEDERWSWYDKLVDTYLPPDPEKAPEVNSPGSVPELDTAKGMEAVLLSAGFIDIQSKSEQLDVVYKSNEQWWATQWSHGGRIVLEKLEASSGSAGLMRFKTAAFEGLNRIKQDDGIHTRWPALFTLARRPEN